MLLKMLLRKQEKNDSSYHRYQCIDVRNILVRNPCKNFKCMATKETKLIISPDILDEYSRVGHILANKYPGVDIGPIIDLITIHSELYIPQPLTAPVSRDPDDDKFISLAIVAHCKIIVSGDKDLLDINRYGEVEFIKPGDFVKQYLP
jgi:putative PIN family toxin of toxin-antitoxin system